MITLNKAFEILDGTVKNSIQSTTEELSLSCECLNRTLAEKQLSKLNLPSFNKSAMDGYAIMANDTHDEYELLGTIAAGNFTSQKLSAGKTVKVMTGAPIPECAEKVVPYEFTAEKNGNIKIIKTPPPINYIYRQGEDVKIDDVIASKGIILGAAEISNLIACGVAKIKVFKQPNVVIISTGDEIVNSSHELTHGKIINSNEPMLETLCYQHKLNVIDKISIKDNYADTVLALKNAIKIADIILLSGGVSAGEFDFVTDALKEVGLITHFNRISIKPGKPTTFATTKNKLVFGLPGNPVAVFLTFHLFVLRALRVMFGAKPDDDYITLPLANDFERTLHDRTEYVPCILKSDRIEFNSCKLNTSTTVIPIEYHGSGHLAALLNEKTYKFFFVINQGVAKLFSENLVQVIQL